MKNRRRIAIILGASLCAALWLIAGPEALRMWGIEGAVNDALVWGPAMLMYFGSIAGDKQTLACEMRNIKRLLGR